MMANQGEDGPYRRGARALLIAGDPGGAAAGEEALAAAGVTLAIKSDIGAAPAAIADHTGVDLILIEARGADPDQLIPILRLIGGDAAEAGPAIVVTLDAEQIDLVAAQLLAGPVQLLCAPTVAERVSALAIALARKSHGFVRADDKDAERLQRLNEEIARIAETLARLTRSEGTAGRAIVGDRSLGYRAAPVAVEVAATEVRMAIRVRQLRHQFFGEGLLEDPAWDMLLDLFAADLERAQVSVSSLCIAAAVAPTTALRWIGRMTEEGLFERKPDPFDRRRAFMALSANAREAMMRYWAAAKQIGRATG